jgi:hypothetical protein
MVFSLKGKSELKMIVQFTFFNVARRTMKHGTRAHVVVAKSSHILVISISFTFTFFNLFHSTANLLQREVNFDRGGV